MKTISDRLNYLRGYLRLSQPDVATRFGIPYNSYIKYEHGSSKPGADAIEGIARAGINTNWLLTGEGPIHLCDLLTGEGEILLSDVRPRPAPPEAQDEQPLMHMAGITTPEGAASAGQAIDESLLSSCHAACRTVYGDEFDALSPVVQIGYATDLYGLLVRLCASNGKDLGEMKRLEVNGLIELLKTYVRLGWARKFPPSAPDLYSF